MVGFKPFKPKNRLPIIILDMNKNNNIIIEKSKTVTYLDNNILVREIGRINSSLIVPKRYSLAIIPAAIIIVNKLIIEESPAFSIVNCHASYGNGLISFSIW